MSGSAYRLLEYPAAEQTLDGRLNELHPILTFQFVANSSRNNGFRARAAAR